MPSQVRGMTPEAIRALFKQSFDAQANQLTLKLSNYNDEVSAMKTAMDASLEALNNDVSESIEAAWSEAKQANEAIQALDAFDKAVASQISGVLDQSQAAIDEANALLAQMPEFEKKAQDAIDKVEVVSTNLTNYKESQQTLLDELNKRADNIQGDLAAQDSKMTQAQADWSRDFEALKESVNQSVDGITEGLSNAVEEQLKISPTLSALSNKLDSTNDSLTQLNEDYTNVNQKVSDITGQVEPLSEQAQQAATDAQKALDALREPIYIGSSLITIDQVTGDPHWTKDASVSSLKTPDGDEVWYVESTQRTSYIDAPYVVVDSRIPYKMSFWGKDDVTGTLFSGRFLDQDGNEVLDELVEGFRSVGALIPYGLALSSEWTKYEAIVRFKETVDRVKFSSIHWNASGENPSRQYIGGFKFFPLIPDQAEIDTLQNNAILKNTKIGASNTNAIDAINEGLKAQDTLNQKQQEWNAIQKIVNDNQQAWNTAQEIVNENQSKWNQAVRDYQTLNDRLWGKQGEINKLNQAIDANQSELLAVNTRAIQSLTNGANIIPYYTPSTTEVANGYNEWTRPVWAKSSLKREQDDSVYKGFGYYHLDKTEYLPAVFFTIDPSIEYDFEVWLRGTEGGGIYIEARDIQGYRVKVAGGIYGDNKPDEVLTRVGSYLVDRKVTHSTWTKYKTRLKFQGDSTQIKIHRIHVNQSFGVQPATLDIGEDMRLYPHIPSQDDVNKALKDADKALKDQLDANGKIDAAQTRADEGFYKAIKALSMPEEANSLFAFIEPSDAEIKAAYESGKSDSLVYDQPEWTLFTANRATKHPNTDTPDYIRGEWTITADANDGTIWLPASKVTYMPVIKGVTYKLSFFGYTNFDNSRCYIQFYDQNESTCFSSATAFIDGVEDPTQTYYSGPSSYYDGCDVLLRRGWHKYEYRIEMLPTTNTIRMAAIYWNHPRGNKGWQRITGMRFVPDIPSQADINKNHKNAIINNSNAIAVNNWSDTIQEIVNKNQQLLIDYNKSLYDYINRWATIRWPRSMYWYPSIGGVPQSYYTGDAPNFFILEDVDLGTRRGVRLTPKNNWDGLLQVIIDWKDTTRTIGLLVRGGKVNAADGKGFVDYWQFDQSFIVGADLRNAIATAYPDTTYDGKPPYSLPSPPNLNTSFPPKPTLRELE